MASQDQVKFRGFFSPPCAGLRWHCPQRLLIVTQEPQRVQATTGHVVCIWKGPWHPGGSRSGLWESSDDNPGVGRWETGVNRQRVPLLVKIW
jgi:hypothetical protein